jgi:hypothetical protein
LRCLKDVRRFLAAIWADWLALTCGTASFLLSALSAIYNTALPPLIYWPVAYGCLFVAAYRIWKKQDAKIARLKRRSDPTRAYRLIEAQRQLGDLTENERRLVGQLVLQGGMLEDRCHRWCDEQGIAEIDIPTFYRKVDFLTFDVNHPCAFKPEYPDVLEELLFSTPETVEGP